MGRVILTALFFVLKQKAQLPTLATGNALQHSSNIAAATSSQQQQPCSLHMAQPGKPGKDAGQDFGAGGDLRRRRAEEDLVH